MRLPVIEKCIPTSECIGAASVAGGALTPQGCNALEWLGCAGAIAACAALSGPALIACVAAAAPGCVKCVK